MAENQNLTSVEEITLEERQWRLSQVYGLLTTVARQKKGEQQQPDGFAWLESDSFSVSRG